jgi:hypothetical protein
VKFLHYAETMQEACLRLMGKKLLVSLAMEGKFSSEGLQAINDDDDILMAMARELVTEKGIGERADIVWAGIQKKQEEVFGVKASEAVESEVEAAKDVVTLPESVPAVADQETALRVSLESVRRQGRQRSATATPEGQLTLF